MLDISILGAGRMGRALALAFDRAGFRVCQIIYRSEAPSDDFFSRFSQRPVAFSIHDLTRLAADVLFITTQDSGIASAASQVENRIKGIATVFITSGALSSDSISNLRQGDTTIGSIHPLVSVSDPILGAERFRDAFFCIEGDPDAVVRAEAIIGAIGGHPFTIPTDKKALYHAAAVISSGHVVALIDIALAMLEKCGLDRVHGKKTLIPLIESTLENLKRQGVEESLTGTFARGDVNTFESHLAALRMNADQQVLDIYLELASRSLQIAERLDGSKEAVGKLKERVLIAKREVG